MSNLETHEAEQAKITAACEAGVCDHPECKPRKFTVILTRDITESCAIEVEAASIAEASDLAMQKLRESENPGWEIDDGSCGASPAYITDVSEEILPVDAHNVLRQIVPFLENAADALIERDDMSIAPVEITIQHDAIGVAHLVLTDTGETFKIEVTKV